REFQRGSVMKRFNVAAFLVFLYFVVSSAANAQSVSGSVTGTVVDPAGAVVVGAPVELVNDTSHNSRKDATNKNGSFTFPSVPPGTYTVRIAQPGFKTYEQQNVIVGTQENLSLHTL